MQYAKVKSGNTLIELGNSWLGEESVYVGGQLVSKKSSFWGVHHHFTVLENGEEAKYVLSTKVGGSLQAYFDLRRNGVLIHEDVLIPMGYRPRKPRNLAKKKGLAYLSEYDLPHALEELKKALEIDPDDPEIYLGIACVYSVQEDADLAFEALRTAVDYQLPDPDRILDQDQLAFVRMHPAFPAFQESKYSRYENTLVLKETQKIKR